MQGSISLIGLTLLTGYGRAPFAVRAASAASAMPRIGIIGAGSPMTRGETMVSMVTVFRQGLKELGYVDGETIVFEDRSARGDFDQLPALVAELIALPVDLLIPIDAVATQAVKDATTTIPILCPSMGDPVGAGWVSSLAHPGGNLTGLTYLSSQLSAKRLDLLKETVPAATRVLVLSNPANPPSTLDLCVTQEAAGALGVQLLSLELQGPSDYEQAFHATVERGVDAIVVLETGYPSNIVDLAAMHALPAIYHVRTPVAAGGLMYYGPNHAPLWSRGAMYADKILKGAKPADLPVEQASLYDLGINLAAAQALGLDFPQSILIQATEVIQGDTQEAPRPSM